MQSLKTKAIVVFSESASLAAWSNLVLGADFPIIWIQGADEFSFNLSPVAAVSDFTPDRFGEVYDFCQKLQIRCFCVSSDKFFPTGEHRRFPKAKFIKMDSSFLLKFSVSYEYQLSVQQNDRFSPTEYFRRLKCAAESDENVLLLGKTGAGKTHDAKIIHQNSKRREGPFVSFTMAESNPNSIEGDLFGVAKNTFTGVSAKDGVLKLAQDGTLFFDEITEIPMDMQAKLLTVISERKFRPKGSDTEEYFSGRFIFATNADIDQMVMENKFREDLYNRINVLRLNVPDLNERAEDIARFAMMYASEKHKSLTKAVLRKLETHRWTGNIRQLRNLVVRACTFARNNIVDLEDLSFD